MLGHFPPSVMYSLSNINNVFIYLLSACGGHRTANESQLKAPTVCVPVFSSKTLYPLSHVSAHLSHDNKHQNFYLHVIVFVIILQATLKQSAGIS